MHLATTFSSSASCEIADRAGDFGRDGTDGIHAAGPNGARVGCFVTHFLVRGSSHRCARAVRIHKLQNLFGSFRRGSLAGFPPSGRGLDRDDPATADLHLVGA